MSEAFDLTTYYAKRIIGDSAAASETSALLQTGSGVTSDTWILHRDNRDTASKLYGIKYAYDGTNGHDKIEYYGKGTSDNATAWIQLDTGDASFGNILGKINITGTSLPSSGNKSYYLTYVDSSSTGHQDVKTSGRLYVYEDTTTSYFNIGSGSTSGGLTIHNANSYYANIVSSAFGANRILTLPDQTGTIALLTKTDINALINLLDTGTSVLTGDDYIITQYVGGGTTTTTYHRRMAKNVRVGGLTTARSLWGNNFDGTADISGNIYVSKAGETYVRATNTTTSCSIELNSYTDKHGLWSSGYWNGSAYTASSKWLIYRGTDGNVVVNGDITGSSATLGCARVTKSVNEHPGKNIVRMQEFSNTSSNLPSSHFYYILEAQGDDPAYSVQLALGETASALYYRAIQNNTYNDWNRIVTNSGSWSISVTGSSGSCTGNAATTTEAKWLMNRGGSTVTIADSSWAIQKTPSGHTNRATVWKQNWKQSGLTYTPSGGSATTNTDTADLAFYLSSSNTSNALQLNMQIDGMIYALGGFQGTLTGNSTGVLDIGNTSKTTTFAYSKAGLAYADYTWLAAWNGYELRAVNKSQFATADHNHNRAGVSKFWYQGRDSAIIKTTSYSGYDAILSMKTTAGDWALGVYTNNIMYFTYILDSNYSANTNTVTKQFIFDPDGTLTATKFSGNLTGNVTGNCSGSSGSCTGHAASDLALTGGQMTGAITFTTAASAAANSTPTALSYGRLQSYGNLCLNANTDNNGTEYVILTSGHGASGSTADGMWISSTNAGLETGDFYVNNGSIWAGTNGSTTAERDLGVRSGAGTMYMYSVASTTGNRGIWLSPHGTATSGKSVFVVDTNNNVTFYGSLSGHASSDLALSGGTMTGNLLGSKTNTIGSTAIANHWYKLYLGGSTEGSNAINSANPLIEFSDSDRSQYGQLIYTDFDAVRSPDGLTWVGNQANSWFQAPRVFGAVWNDYAEYRETKEEIQPGRCVVETGNGDLVLSTERLQGGCEIVSDTFGFAIGYTKTCKTPTACAGRVLAYLYEDNSLAKPGDPVCSGPNGTVSLMTHEEEIKWPSRIIATVSEIPTYDEWEYGSADEFGVKEKLKVDGRIWIRIR